MSIRSGQCSLSHYTDWTIGHVHSGALGWVAFISPSARSTISGARNSGNASGSIRVQLVEVAFLDRDTWAYVLYIVSMWVYGHHGGSDVAVVRRPRILAVCVH